jgi:hypothetical protein
MNMHVTVEELLDMLYSMRSVSYHRKAQIGSSQNFVSSDIGDDRWKPAHDPSLY